MNSPGTKAPRIIAGAMSGTSADGVDVAVTRIKGRGLDMSAQLLLHHHRAYDAETRKAIFQMRESGNTSLRNLAHITRQITLTYAAAINEALLQAKLSANDLAAASAHGQTLFHDPPLTMQIFDPSLLAGEVGCAVVSDFRRADLAAGGQGAPLVPFADYILFRDAKKSRVLLNIGGIANITHLPAGAKLNQVIAFDTGPGNCISDHICRKHDPQGWGFDIDGVLATQGKPSREIYDWFMANDYFSSPPPKSTDGPAMVALFESVPPAMRSNLRARAASNELEINDLLATAAQITGWSIQRAVYELIPKPVDEIIISGGGTKNKGIMWWLSFEFMFGGTMLSSSELGVPSDAKEALAFALLAAATLDGVPSNVPSATGAKRAVVLGSITPRPS